MISTIQPCSHHNSVGSHKPVAIAFIHHSHIQGKVQPTISLVESGNKKILTGKM